MNNGVVIVTYNRMELLKECLACVCGQTIPFSRVIVVNNCSTDGTTEYLKAYAEDERVVVVNEEQNLGGAGGFYDGLKIASEQNLDWVLIIDDDAMIAPDYMERLLEEREKILVSGGKEVYALAGCVRTEGRVDLSHRRRVTSKFFFVESPVAGREYQSSHFTCDCATFCGLVIAGSKLEEIGLPKKEYFLWYDDTEYCLRLKDCGGITVVTSAELNHKTKFSKEGMVVKGLLNRIGWRQYYGYRNRYDAAKNHLGRASAWCILWQYRFLRFLSRCMLLRKKTRQQGQSNIRILGDVICDCKTGRLGQHPEYHY